MKINFQKRVQRSNKDKLPATKSKKSRTKSKKFHWEMKPKVNKSQMKEVEGEERKMTRNKNTQICRSHEILSTNI